MEDINCWQEKFTPCQYSDKLLNRIIKLNNCVSKPVNINEITKAIYYAKKYHGNQMRQSGEPYYSHPLEVAYMVSEHTAIKIPEYFKTDLIIIALLHDTIEDTCLTKDMISSIFNNRISEQVDDLTRIKVDGKISAAQVIEILFLQGKYDLAHIKLFDRIHNLQTLYIKSPEKAKKIIEETITHFIILAIQLEIPIIKNQLIELCNNYISLNTRQSIPLYRKMTFQDNYLLPSLT